MVSDDMNQTFDLVTADTEVLLAARECMYCALHLVFGGHPSVGMLEELARKDYLGVLDLYSENEGDAFSCAKERIEECLCNGEAMIGDLERNYMALFVGPGSPTAPLWESVYIGISGRLLQECTLEVRYAYAEFGYLPKEYKKVADDHLSIMMDFMVKMNAETRAALDSKDAAQYRKLLYGQQRFIRDHLLDWVPDLADKIKEEDTSGLYAAIAQCALAFFETDAAAIGEILEETRGVAGDVAGVVADDDADAIPDVVANEAMDSSAGGIANAIGE